MNILSLCDHSGTMLKPWAERGHYCVAVDIAQDRPGERDGIVYVRQDVFDFDPELEPAFDYIFAFPPCTDLAASGARWWEQKGLRATIEALELVEACLKICQTAELGWMIENPIGRLANLWRKPDHYFDPCDYGDPYTKKTCLWTGGDFVMPPKNRVEPERVCKQGSWVQKLGGKSERTKRLRSVTPPGFASAVYEANK